MNLPPVEGSYHRTAAGANSPVLERHNEGTGVGQMVCHAGVCSCSFYVLNFKPTLDGSENQQENNLGFLSNLS